MRTTSVHCVLSVTHKVRAAPATNQIRQPKYGMCPIPALGAAGMYRPQAPLHSERGFPILCASSMRLVSPSLRFPVLLPSPAQLCLPLACLRSVRVPCPSMHRATCYLFGVSWLPVTNPTRIAAVDRCPCLYTRHSQNCRVNTVPSHDDVYTRWPTDPFCSNEGLTPPCCRMKADAGFGRRGGSVSCLPAASAAAASCTSRCGRSI